MQVITIATERNRHLERLLASARQFGIEVKILGEGKQYHNHNHKTEILLDYLSSIPAEEIVMYVDGYDCIFLRDLDYVQDTFEKYGHPLVMSTEQNFNCDAPLFKKLRYYLAYSKGTKPYRFINAGNWIGRAGYTRSILSQVIEDGGNDQSVLNIFFSKHPEAIRLDYNHELFTCTAGRMGLEKKDYTLVDGRLRNNLTGSFPAVFHAAGKNFYGLAIIVSMLPFMAPEEAVSEEAAKSYRKYRRWNQATALLLPDNFLFHLLLRVGGIGLALLLLMYFIQ